MAFFIPWSSDVRIFAYAFGILVSYDVWNNDSIKYVMFILFIELIHKLRENHPGANV